MNNVLNEREQKKKYITPFCLLLFFFIFLASATSYQQILNSTGNLTSTQKIYLETGWNLISFRVNPTDKSVATIFQSIAGKYDRVMGIENGQEVFYNPASPGTSTFQEIDPLHGYYIHILENIDFEVTGEIIAHDTPIELNPGDNLVAFLPSQSLTVDYASRSILNKVEWIKTIDHEGIANGQRDDGGITFDPNNYELSTLQFMRPGSGYRIKLNEAATLVYPSANNEASVTIGPQGGIVMLEDFQLVVPEGAFMSDTKIDVEASIPPESFGYQTLSRQYTVNGLPGEINQLIEVRFTYTGEITGESVIIVSEAETDDHSNPETLGHYMYPAEKKNGYVSCQISSFEGTAQLQKRLDTDKRPKTTFHHSGQAKTIDTDHFNVTFPIHLAAEQAIDKMFQYLDLAYRKIETIIPDIGRMEREKTPFRVQIMELNPSTLIQYKLSSWSGAWLEFNSDIVWDYEKIYNSIGPELFRMIQAIKDPRWYITQNKHPPVHLWLNEATLEWFKGFYTGKKRKYSLARVDAPFGGMHKEPGLYWDEFNTIDARTHGRSMLPLISYLVEKQGKSIIDKLYYAISHYAHPVSAVLEIAYHSVDNWWPDFLKWHIEHLTDNEKREIYFVKSDYINLPETVFNYKMKYPYLSAKLFDIYFSYPYFTKEDVVKFQLHDSPTGVLTLFKRHGLTWTFIDQQKSVVFATDPKTLFDSKMHLAALVTNTQYNYLSSDSANMHLEVSIPEMIDLSLFNLCYLDLSSSRGLNQEYSNKGFFKLDSLGHGFSITNLNYKPGAFTLSTVLKENTFYVSWDTSWQSDGIMGPTFYTEDGHIEVILDSMKTKAISFEGEWHHKEDFQAYADINKEVIEWREKCSGSDIPFFDYHLKTPSGKYQPGLTFMIRGPGALNHASSYEYKQTSKRGDVLYVHELLELWPEANNQISVHFSHRDY